MIDQELHRQMYQSYEVRKNQTCPGLFQAVVTGTGAIDVVSNYVLVGSLKQNILLKDKDFKNIFGISLIVDKIYTNGWALQGKKFVDVLGINNNVEKRFFEDISIESIVRILLKIQNYQHGGTLIIKKGSSKDLNIKHKMSYTRLSECIVDQVRIESSKVIIRNFRKNKDEKENILSSFESSFNEIEEIKKGALRFISSLSCIDGAVVLDYKLGLIGFGAFIKSSNKLETVKISTTLSLNPDNFRSMKITDLGSRHQSAFRYCYNNPDSIAFVISQDGIIRAVKRVDDNVVVWENIIVRKNTTGLVTSKNLTSEDIKNNVLKYKELIEAQINN